MGKFTYSFNGENYTGKFDTREDAIREAAESQAGVPFPNTEVRVGECAETPLSWTDMAEDIVDNMKDHLVDDYGGDLAEHFDDQVSGEDMDLLNERVNAAIEEWIRDCGIKAGFYMVENEQKIYIGDIIPEEYEV